MNENPFDYNNYLLVKQFLKLFGETFRIYSPTNDLILFANMKAFKLREDISIYADEGKTIELIRIKARSIIDIWSIFDVYDAQNGSKIGSLKRKALSSIIKDEWAFLDTTDQETGVIQEDSLPLALLRRLIGGGLIPQTYHGSFKAIPVLTFKQRFNPFIQRMDLDFSMDQMSLLDKRLGIAAAVLLCAIEGRQS